MHRVILVQKWGVCEIILPVFEILHMFVTWRSVVVTHSTSVGMKNRMKRRIQPPQTKPIISRFTGQEQLPVVKESRGLSSFFMSLRTFKGSQALSAHNLFLFFYCFDVISCFPRRELAHSGGEMDKSGCAGFDIEIRLLCSLQADTH